MTLPTYAELHCLSNFSFLRGASHPEELVARAHVLGYTALAITDECSVAGVVRAHLAVKTCNAQNRERPPMKLLIGSEMSVENGPKLVVLATNRAGYGALCALITRARMRTRKGEYRVELADLENGLPGCLVLLVPDAQCNAVHAQFVAQHFPGRAWIAVELVCGPNDAARLTALRTLSASSSGG